MAAMEMLRIMHPEESLWKLCNQLTPQVRAKWVVTNPLIVLIKDESISKKIVKNYETALVINNNKAKAKSKNLFRQTIYHLFDILVCQCPINMCELSDCNTAQCEGGAHIFCSCPREYKIPSMELKFILDQREKIGFRGGEMQIGGADKVEAARQKKNLLRKKRTTTLCYVNVSRVNTLLSMKCTLYPCHQPSNVTRVISCHVILYIADLP